MIHASAIAIGASGNAGMGASGINIVNSGAHDDLGVTGLKALQKNYCGAPLGIIHTSAIAIGASGISAFGIEADGHMVSGASGIREIIMSSTLALYPYLILIPEVTEVFINTKATEVHVTIHNSATFEIVNQLATISSTLLN
ncbi:hypothetical protein GGX14DRAFT_389619 [Mycena pura]|uniref:Uncharacterized protein n=1 Tax=Mycena pura TaxID=153505 RepID=A0AAD6VS21_9AGAR|nr:hypothetical protein GGX14DRAFT_396373 [Mycena pura]KAJ7217221.1 hypothetical protein GGX14DRAFT_391033 [Mycena pura]KAJ7220250.1 hypothetical protein GGX14DRAFT_389619 [Mycena pura]